MTFEKTKNLKKYYGTEPNITKALDGVTTLSNRENLLPLWELPAAENPHCSI